MEDKDRIVFRIGNKKQADRTLLEFLKKYPQDQWNMIIKSIAVNVITQMTPKWDPIVNGYPFFLNPPHPTVSPMPEEAPPVRKPQSSGGVVLTKPHKEIPRGAGSATAILRGK